MELINETICDRWHRKVYRSGCYTYSLLIDKRTVSFLPPVEGVVGIRWRKNPRGQDLKASGSIVDDNVIGGLMA